MTYRAPKGTDDVLPPDSRTWERLLRVWDDVTSRFGYGLVVTPLFEATEVFARGVGDATDIVEKQMYTFEDRSGRSLTLRPEGTAPIVRAYIQAGRSGAFKASYSGPMFRYEQPQAGRRRQFFQVGVEYLGEDAPGADVEVIELGYRYFEGIGLDGVTVTLNTLGDQSTRPAYRAALREYLAGLDLCDDCRSRIDRNPLRVFDCKVDGPRLVEAPSPVDYLSLDAATHYDQVRRGLDTVGVPFVEQPRLVRGLDYYTRTVFEYVATGLETAQNAVGGGGRYDGLSEALGGPPLPSVGLALGIDRIVLALGSVEEGPALDVFVVVASPQRAGEALQLVSRLRNQGIRADLDVASRSVKAQFKVADRRRARTAVVVGDEWEYGKVSMRNLVDGTQELIEIGEVAEWATRP